MDTIHPLLKDYFLQLGDNALILGHRMSEWCGHGPQLEEDIAMTNIALDLIGQARLYYQHVAMFEDGKTEDDFAYLRKEHDFKNVLLVEYPNVDFAYTVVRSFCFDSFHFYLLEALQDCVYEPLANIAKQAIKEVSYHRKHMATWMLRLGDGTEVSHQKVVEAISDLWPYTGELFTNSEADTFMFENYGIDLKSIQDKWVASVDIVFEKATVEKPEDAWMQKGGKQGVHTENMGFILADLQYMQRAYPNMKW